MNKKKPRILYLMHVPWCWIKQRPHFIAEGLSKYYAVDVIAKPSISQNDKVISKFCNIKKIGFAGDSVLMKIINNILMILVINFYCSIRRYSYLFITDPRLIKYYKKIIFKKPLIIYDCMDNTIEFEEFQNNNIAKDKFLTSEELTLKQNYLTVTSSSTLKEILLLRYNLNSSNILVINNALDKNFTQQLMINEQVSEYCNRLHNNGCKIIMYAGTIDSWMQFDWLEKIVSSSPTIAIVLLGPNVAGFSSNNERLILSGAIEHPCLYNALRFADLFIMPFRVNKLIESVDPVKIYEYLVYNKPIILPYYSELDKFVDYQNIHFYKTFAQFKDLIEKCIFSKNIIKESFNVGHFIEANSWSARVEKIHSNLGVNQHSLLKSREI